MKLKPGISRSLSKRDGYIHKIKITSVIVNLDIE